MKADFFDTADRRIRFHQIQVRVNGKIIERIKYPANDTEARFQATQKARKIIRGIMGEADPDPDKIEWKQIGTDDHTANLPDYTLRAEEMSWDTWWWAVYIKLSGRAAMEIDSDNVGSLEQAKAAAEKAYRNHRSKTI